MGLRRQAWCFVSVFLLGTAAGGPAHAAAATAETPWWWGAAAAPLLTGAALAYLAIRVDSRKILNQELIRKRIDLYDQVAPRLNDLLCAFLVVGHWRELPPPVVVQTKRDLDRVMHVYGPLFSQVVVSQYKVFIHKCFRTFTGSGRDALLRADRAHLQKEWGEAWQTDWNQRFVIPRDVVTERELRDAYARLMSELAAAIGTPRPSKRRSSRQEAFPASRR